MHPTTSEGNTVMNMGKLNKLVSVEDYSQYMAHTNKVDRIAKSYSISKRTWKIIFYLSVPTTLDRYINLSSCSRRTDHRKLYLVLVQNLLQTSTRQPHPQSTPRGGSHLQCPKCLNSYQIPVHLVQSQPVDRPMFSNCNTQM